MGCDIHAVIERRKSYRNDEGTEYMARWLNAGDPDIGRDYEVFAVLAGVRNHTDVTPISEPRGLPGVTEVYGDESGFEGEFAEHPCAEFETYYMRWRGDAHSESWLGLAEVKAFDATQTVFDPSVITDRDESGRVLATAGGVWRQGRDVTPELEKVGERRIFTWPGHAAEHKSTWTRLIEAMERAKHPGDTDEQIRLVFFFDN